MLIFFFCCFMTLVTLGVSIGIATQDREFPGKWLVGVAFFAGMSALSLSMGI